MFASAISRKAAEARGRIGPGVHILLALVCVFTIVAALLGTILHTDRSAFEISTNLFVPDVCERLLRVPFELQRSAELGRKAWR